jgi:EmrB/QacA subfamily drug resistance transporter
MSNAVADQQSAAIPTGSSGELSHKEILEVMVGLLAALFTALLSATIVSTALPTIMSDLHGTQSQYTWVITASLLAMTISTPIWGKLSDLFDKKTLVQLSIVVFVLGSVGAGLTQSVIPMMAFRALQGLGMGGLTALVQSIMGTIIAPRNRGRYTGYMGAVMAVATVSGPLLGGVITDNLNWRWCFFVCVPLAVVALILLQITLHLPALQRRRVTIDYLGAALLAVAAALPMLWVTFAGVDYDWFSWQSGVFLAGFLAAGALAVFVELRVPEPMVPIRVLRNNTTALMIIASIAVGVAMFGSSTFLTQYFQLAGGNSPTKAGLMTIPLIVAQMLSATIGGQIVSRTGRWKPLMVVGSIMLVIGLGGLGTIDHTTGYLPIAIFMAVMGIGIGTLIQNIVLAVQNTVDVKDIGAASATISFFRSLGGAVGVAVLGAVLASQVLDKTAAGLQRLGIPMSAAGDGSLDIKDLPTPVQAVLHSSYGDSFGSIFLIAAITSVVTMLAIFFVKSAPLRTTVAMPQQADRPGAGTGAEIELETIS